MWRDHPHRTPIQQPAVASKPLAKPPIQEPEPAPASAGVADRKLARQNPGDSWAVIAGTYGRFEAAQKHADIYQKEFPQIKPHVFPAEGQGRHYLIVLGSGLTQDAAERLRHDLIEQGAPPDTYVTKIFEN